MKPDSLRPSPVLGADAHHLGLCAHTCVLQHMLHVFVDMWFVEVAQGAAWILGWYLCLFFCVSA